MSPIKGLLRSRKFWLLMLDALISLLLYTVGAFIPGAIQHVKVYVAILQPIFIFIILAIAYEDGQAKRAGNFNH